MCIYIIMYILYIYIYNVSDNVAKTCVRLSSDKQLWQCTAGVSIKLAAGSLRVLDPRALNCYLALSI